MPSNDPWPISKANACFRSSYYIQWNLVLHTRSWGGSKYSRGKSNFVGKWAFLVGGYDFLYRNLQLPAFSEVQVRRPLSSVYVLYWQVSIGTHFNFLSNKAVADSAVSSYTDALVTSRTSRYTYGIKCYKTYDPSLSDHRKREYTRFTSLSGVSRLPNAFSSSFGAARTLPFMF